MRASSRRRLAAPAERLGEGRPAAELPGDPRVGEQPPDAGRPDEEPLVGARPGEEEPAAVRRPRDVAEASGADEDAARAGVRAVGVEQQQLARPDHGQAMRTRLERGGDDAAEEADAGPRAAEDDELVRGDEREPRAVT